MTHITLASKLNINCFENIFNCTAIILREIILYKLHVAESIILISYSSYNTYSTKVSVSKLVQSTSLTQLRSFTNLSLQPIIEMTLYHYKQQWWTKFEKNIIIFLTILFMKIVNIHIPYGICELAHWFPKISMSAKEQNVVLFMDNRTSCYFGPPQHKWYKSIGHLRPVDSISYVPSNMLKSYQGCK